MGHFDKGSEKANSTIQRKIVLRHPGELDHFVESHASFRPVAAVALDQFQDIDPPSTPLSPSAPTVLLIFTHRPIDPPTSRMLTHSSGLDSTRQHARGDTNLEETQFVPSVCANDFV